MSERPFTDTSERGLERLICTALTGAPCDPGVPANRVQQRPATYAAGWICGAAEDYDREYCVDLAQLAAFLRETQPEVCEALHLGQDGPTRRKFLARLQGEISKRGTIDLLRHGLKHGPHHIDLFYGTPSPGNPKAAQQHAANRFSVTRQLRYSRDETQRALDLGLFINGLPVATFELKNSLTKQTVEDAVQQYQRDRDPREKLFEFGRCVVHFAVDDHEVRFCTHLKGKGSWFLPFNLGWNDGAGNPPNPNGLKTDYLWKRILTRAGLTDILENYAQIVETRDEKTGRKKQLQIWPRYHQLDVVRRLLAHAQANGAGRRYLIQHSAGSGKSNSIAWLAHQLIGLAKDGAPVFDSIIVVTDPARHLTAQRRAGHRHRANPDDSHLPIRAGVRARQPRPEGGARHADRARTGAPRARGASAVRGGQSGISVRLSRIPGEGRRFGAGGLAIAAIPATHGHGTRPTTAGTAAIARCGKAAYGDRRS